jgi:uncharacterized tellurite resistance protein B-like protein
MHAWAERVIESLGLKPYIAFMIAALALKETASIYEGALERPQADVSTDYAERVRRGIDAAERLVRDRKIKAIHERAKLNEAFEALRSAEGGIPTEIKEELDRTIFAIVSQIAEHVDAVEDVQKKTQDLLENVRKLSPKNFKVARKEIARFIEYGKEMHSDMVDMYYFLLSIKSELDPETNIGPSFDNPDELKAFLDAELAE